MKLVEFRVTPPLVRQYPRYSRNQPCPCGSGKKLKHCHLNEAQQVRADHGAVKWAAEKLTAEVSEENE